MVEAMRPFSSRAGMTTESRESGQKGLVSGRADIFAFPNGEAGGVGGFDPTEIDIGPIAEADFLFEGADHGTEILETKHWMYWRRLF